MRKTITALDIEKNILLLTLFRNIFPKRQWLSDIDSIELRIAT